MVRRMAWALLVGAVAVACGTSTDPATFGATGASGATTTGSTSGSGGAAPLVCAPGKQEACPCVNGAQGAQACADDGASWGECICPAVGGAGQGGAAAGGAGNATTTSGAGGSGGAGGATTATGGTGGAGGAPPCSSPSDCPGADAECGWRTCSAGACGVYNKPAGAPLASQPGGDCAHAVCDGAGDATSEYDPGDLALDASECTDDICTPQGPAHPSRPDGTFCLSACACPPCKAPPPGPPPIGGYDCSVALCSAGLCVPRVPVVCKVGIATYQGCDGVMHQGQAIYWNGGECGGSSQAVAYCPPGTGCSVMLNGGGVGAGTCQ